MRHRPRSRDAMLDLLGRGARPLRGRRDDFDPLLELIGDASLVLLGEASHGTHEFYRARAEITKRLILEKGFVAVAVEADWPDAYRVNRWVRGGGPDDDAVEALAGFARFPAWMWRNADVLDFVGWLREHNDGCDAGGKTGFYGLDLYSLYSSIGAVIGYLDRADPEAARRARLRYACFNHRGADDPQRYGYETGLGIRPDCEREAIEQLLDLRRRAVEILRGDGVAAEDEQFYAERNAWVVRSAEAYYRAMFGRGVNTWNLRDRHMAGALDSLREHLSARRPDAKTVVWAHNSHLGDARATEMADRGELNLGQLVRERHTGDCALVGFTTFEGTVSAADNWGGPVRRQRVRPGLEGGVEHLFHGSGERGLYVPLREGPLAEALRAPLLERAIGVIYRPESERQSHYFWARLTDQFDAVLHYDHTRAVEPLERTAGWREDEIPETYPTGL